MPWFGGEGVYEVFYYSIDVIHNREYTTARGIAIGSKLVIRRSRPFRSHKFAAKPSVSPVLKDRRSLTELLVWVSFRGTTARMHTKMRESRMTS